jgi:hypothetical protein
MVRMKIAFTAEQSRRLRAEALRRRVSVAAVVREAVDRGLPPESDQYQARFDRTMAAAGTLRSGAGDASARHDEIAGDGRW